MIKRYEKAPIKGQRYSLRPGAYAVIWNGSALLTTFQGEPHFELQLPGGGIDPGESPVQALHREVREETGWSIAAPRRLGAFRTFSYMPEYSKFAEKLCHVYLARPALRHGPPIEQDHSVVWCQPDEAIEMMPSAGARAFLAAFFA